MPALVKEVKYGQDNPIDAAPVLSDEDKYAIKKRIEALDKLLAADKKAKYKIEVFFSRKRTSHSGPYAGAISLWESGTKFHGGGDTKLYECPGKVRGVNDCAGFIPDPSNGYGFLVCPSCQQVWKGELVYGEVLLKLSTSAWAEVLLRYFVRLGHNADIYMKHPIEDIRAASHLEQEKQWMGEKLTKARTATRTAIYPLRNIIKDTSSGADLLGRFHAFLLA